MSPLEKFCRQFSFTLPIAWYGGEGEIPLGDRKVVRVALTDVGYADKYVGFEVKIVHKENGTIAVHTFRFDDVMTPKDRIDDRIDGPHAYTVPAGARLFHGWYHMGDCSWYIAVPSEDAKNRFTGSVERWINTWK